MLHVFVHKYIIVHYQADEFKARKNKNLEKLFRENKTSPLLKTPEKDFQNIWDAQVQILMIWSFTPS